MAMLLQLDIGEQRSNKLIWTSVAHRLRSGGFSIVEIIAVVAIVSILVTLLMPAIRGLDKGVMRRIAVSTTLSVLDQARSAALTMGKNVFVVFMQSDFPAQDSMIVLCESDDKQGAETIIQQNSLPREIGFCVSRTMANIFKAGLLSKISLPSMLRGVPSDRLGVIAFSPQGTIWYPILSEDCCIILSGDRKGINAKRDADTRLERIVVSRLTGRAVVVQGGADEHRWRNK